jgi:hypothetical protein
MWLTALRRARLSQCIRSGSVNQRSWLWLKATVMVIQSIGFVGCGTGSQ